MNQSHWTLFIFLLGCLLVMYFYLYLSTEFRHIVISTETGGTEPRDYILINRMLEGIKTYLYVKYLNAYLDKSEWERRRHVKSAILAHDPNFHIPIALLMPIIV
jgi:hypothetical protein